MIGGGNSAAEESLFLTRFASHVTILVRGDALSASAVVREKVAECDTITVRPHIAVEGFEGAHSHLTAVRVRDTASGATETLHPAGVFVFIGLRPNTAFLRGIVALDEHGFIITDAGLQTNMPGLFAAGDARVGSTEAGRLGGGRGGGGRAGDPCLPPAVRRAGARNGRGERYGCRRLNGVMAALSIC